MDRSTGEPSTLRKAYARFGEGRTEKYPSRQLAGRLLYFLLGFNGPREEAEEIKRQLKEFMRANLKLELSEPKTLITHARSEAARFLGYDIVTLHNDGRRTINGTVGLKVPVDVVRAKCAPYMHRGKPIHRTERMNDSVFSIITRYQQEFRGIVEYYRLAFNLSTRFSWLKWVMETSLTKTLASKLRISVNEVYKRFQTTIQAESGSYKALRVEVPREGKKPLVAQWGGISLAWRKDAVLNDDPLQVRNKGTELEERLLADACELCGSQEDVNVHHERALKDLQHKGKAEWVKRMAARQRKTLIVCRKHHDEIHSGRYDGSPVKSGKGHWRAT